jgi:hypothetical protein
MRDRRGRTFRADDFHLEGIGLSRQLLSDRAQAEYAEGLAGKWLRDTPRPAALTLLERALHQRFRQEKECCKNIFRHLYAMRAARAGENHIVAQVGVSQPVFHAGGRALDPAQSRHGREQSWRWSPAHQYFAARREIDGDNLVIAHAVHFDSIGESGACHGALVNMRFIHPHDADGFSHRR